MARVVEAETVHPPELLEGVAPPIAVDRTHAALPRQLLLLAAPILAENVLHMGVGLTDVYLAGHLDAQRAAATAAVGVVSYILWLVGVFTGAIGAGSTALIARAVGAKDRALADSACGQSIGGAALAGMALAAVFYVSAPWLAPLSGLSGPAQGFVLYYFRVVCLSLPFSMVMLAGGACLRGAGDTLSPAMAMIVVDLVNVGASAALTYGWLGLPAMGFRGIALGTLLAYFIGGILLVGILLRGSHSIRLVPRQLRPHWPVLRRVLRVGLPAGAGETLMWVAQFAIVLIINRIDQTNVSAAAHILTVRVESLSYLAGYALSVAAATLVGQNLGRDDPARAARAAWLAFAVGAGIMAAWGVVFIFFGRSLTAFFNADPTLIDLSARCLYIVAFAQIGFAAAMVFGGALRGAGDTLVLMGLTLSSTLLLRLTGVLVVVFWLRLGLAAIWMVLAAELMCRGALVMGRFLQGGWRHVKV